MRLLPREWEGLHEAFPKLDEEIDLRGPILAAGAFATICGGTSSLIWAGLNLLRRRPFGDPNFLLRGPGFLILPVTAAAVLVHERERVAWSADIKSVLENDGISMPPRRYFQRTSAWSFEDSAFVCNPTYHIITPCARICTLPFVTDSMHRICHVKLISLVNQFVLTPSAGCVGCWIRRSNCCYVQWR